ncbi:MAG: Cdc6/Cdc18 family protein [Nitrosopumilus sp.]
MNKRDLQKIAEKARQDNKIFKQKSKLVSLSNEIPDSLVGRSKETQQLVRYLVSYEEGMVVPLISVFGRSGSGKSSLVKFVCSNMTEFDFCHVNFRKAKTIFGCANLILGEFGVESMKSAKGLNTAIDAIYDSIVQKIMDSMKLFVLILDEFDMIMYDRRGNPSDFVYKLIEMQSDLAQSGFPMTIITISNNVIGDYEFDDRVRSRIGSSEIFFAPFSKEDILGILKKRSREAFDFELDSGVLEYVAEICSDEHGDIRRAMELLRVTAEIASSKNKPISKEIVDITVKQLEKDRLEETLNTLSEKSKKICFAIAVLNHIEQKEWPSTMQISEYCRKMLPPGTSFASNRRIGELLVDMKNTQVVSAYTTSEGRNGYNSKYRLNMNPETVGKMIDEEKWNKIIKDKEKKERDEFIIKELPRLYKLF